MAPFRRAACDLRRVRNLFNKGLGKLFLKPPEVLKVQILENTIILHAVQLSKPDRFSKKNRSCFRQSLLTPDSDSLDRMSPNPKTYRKTWLPKPCGVLKCILAMLTGVLRGTGTQAIGAVMSFVTFWVIGLPLSYALAFKLRWGMVGLWVARATVTTLQVGVHVLQNRAF